MFKVLSDYFNNHRLSRKPMPAEEREEFIRKSKEFSAFKVFNKFFFFIFVSFVIFVFKIIKNFDI